MLIYRMTHIPSNKIYIGALKDDNKWDKYKTSSKTVKARMKESPDEWTKEILLNDFSETVTFSDVVSLEQAIIKQLFIELGKEKMFNKGYFSQQSKLYGRGVPKTAFKKGNVPWSAGKKLGPSTRLGKSYVEQYGEEKAKQIIEIQVANKKSKAYPPRKGNKCSEETKAKIRLKRKEQVIATKGKTKADYPNLSNSGIKKGSKWSAKRREVFEQQKLAKKNNDNPN